MKTFLMTAAAVCAFAASSAQAATMTFSGVGTASSSGAAYVEDGITMANSSNNNYRYGYQNAGTLHLDQGTSNGIYDFTFGTGAFDLASVDVAVAGGTGIGTFTAFDANNVQIGTASFAASTTGTKNVSLAGITRLHLVATGTHFNIDNLVLNAATGAVPEPATWAMMMLGFGGMGYTLRRRSAKVARIRFA